MLRYRGVTDVGDVLEKLEMSGLKAAELRFAPFRFEFLGSSKQYPSTGEIDVLQAATLECNLPCAVSLNVTQGIIQLPGVAERPVVLEADRESVRFSLVFEIWTHINAVGDPALCFCTILRLGASQL